MTLKSQRDDCDLMAARAFFDGLRAALDRDFQARGEYPRTQDGITGTLPVPELLKAGPQWYWSRGDRYFFEISAPAFLMNRVVFFDSDHGGWRSNLDSPRDYDEYLKSKPHR